MNAYERGDTMVDAIALSSPSGRMSKRAREMTGEIVPMVRVDPLPEEIVERAA